MSNALTLYLSVWISELECTYLVFECRINELEGSDLVRPVNSSELTLYLSVGSVSE